MGDGMGAAKALNDGTASKEFPRPCALGEFHPSFDKGIEQGIGFSPAGRPFDPAPPGCECRPTAVELRSGAPKARKQMVRHQNAEALAASGKRPPRPILYRVRFGPNHLMVTNFSPLGALILQQSDVALRSAANRHRTARDLEISDARLPSQAPTDAAVLLSIRAAAYVIHRLPRVRIGRVCSSCSPIGPKQIDFVEQKKKEHRRRAKMTMDDGRCSTAAAANGKEKQSTDNNCDRNTVQEGDRLPLQHGHSVDLPRTTNRSFAVGTGVEVIVQEGNSRRIVRYVAKAKPGRWPYVDGAPGLTEAPFKGDPEAFISAQDAAMRELVRVFLTNKGKNCEACGKPNAFTVAACNGCGANLSSIPVGTTINVFMGFVFGIEKGPSYPFTASIRHQCAKALVFDDLLGLSPLHLNAIPTSQYIPDWRYLLRRPKEALELVQFLLEKCQTAAMGFLSNEKWRRKMLHPDTPDDFDPFSIVTAAFNYPPSQSQLHLRYLLPILTPFHLAHFRSETKVRRLFPMEYVVKCLLASAPRSTGASTEPAPASSVVPPHLLLSDTSVDDIILYFDTEHKINYDQYLSDFLSSFLANSKTYSGWNSDDFEGFVVETGDGGKELSYHAHDGSSQAAPISVDIAKVNRDDKLMIQNYGRPYRRDLNGKLAPGGYYYSFFKSPGEIDVW